MIRVWGGSLWSQPHREHKGHQAINQICSQPSGKITGYTSLLVSLCLCEHKNPPCLPHSLTQDLELAPNPDLSPTQDLELDP